MTRATFSGSFEASSLTNAGLIKKDLEKALAAVCARYPGQILFSIDVPAATKKRSSKTKGKASTKKKPTLPMPATKPARKHRPAKTMSVNFGSLFDDE